ncbi:MAG: hypothetical protein K8T25_17185 [Planctomycetia bacterium]|nr:hypothetical protein [Planctomycetia bacterium]
MAISEDPDFIQAVGEELSYAICPPVPFEDASAHECYEALCRALGQPITTEQLRSFSQKQIETACAGIATYFECEPIGVDRIKQAIAGILARWPTSS